MSSGKAGNSKGNRRLGRARAFQALYGMSFARAGDERQLNRLFTEALVTIEAELRALHGLPATVSLAWEQDEEQWRLVSGEWTPALDPAATLARILQFPKIESARRVEFELRRAPLDAAELPEEASNFAWTLFSGVWRNRAALDETIAKYSQHWKIERIARVELAILRLAIYEMLHVEDLPLKVAINEAVELSKSYGDENSRNFVNGILDGVARAVVAGDFGITKTF